MRSIRAVFYVFAAGILVSGCSDGGDLVRPAQEPARSGYFPPFYPEPDYCDPCNPPPEGSLVRCAPAYCPYDPVY